MTTVRHLGHESAYRGEDLVTKRAETKIVLLGVGALGSWLLDLLARQGFTSITIVDFDKVDDTNFGTQNYGARERGREKVAIAARNLYLRLGVSVEAISQKVTAKNVNKILKDADLVVDLFDNHESRNLVRDHCADKGINCLHAGMSHDGFAEVEWNENYRAHPVPVEQDDTDVPCEYPLASNLVHITVGLVSEIITRFVDTGVKESVHFTLGDLHTHKVWSSGS